MSLTRRSNGRAEDIEWGLEIGLIRLRVNWRRLVIESIAGRLRLVLVLLLLLTIRVERIVKVGALVGVAEIDIN